MTNRSLLWRSTAGSDIITQGGDSCTEGVALDSEVVSQQLEWNFL